LQKFPRKNRVDLRLGCRGTAIPRNDGALAATCSSRTCKSEIRSRLAFNCTYSVLNRLGGDYTPTRARLKHEITDMELVHTREMLSASGVPVLDGPFFSLMPFLPRGLHSLSDVSYTPHASWLDVPGMDPYERLARYERRWRVERMQRDAARYLPAGADAVQVDSLFETKSVLMKNEMHEGRAILFERYEKMTDLFSVLGGKIENIYDVFQRLDAVLPTRRMAAMV
jgi:hypothetical protein